MTPGRRPAPRSVCASEEEVVEGRIDFKITFPRSATQTVRENVVLFLARPAGAESAFVPSKLTHNSLKRLSRFPMIAVEKNCQQTWSRSLTTAEQRWRVQSPGQAIGAAAPPAPRPQEQQTSLCRGERINSAAGPLALGVKRRGILFKGRSICISSLFAAVDFHPLPEASPVPDRATVRRRGEATVWNYLICETMWTGRLGLGQTSALSTLLGPQPRWPRFTPRAQYLTYPEHAGHRQPFRPGWLPKAGRLPLAASLRGEARRREWRAARSRIYVLQ